jgi:2,4-dienoyl-CoA reductase-like NADH-dependent reductase (Old Yellow Enzyme family)
MAGELLTSFSLSGLKLKNRVVMAPLTRARSGSGRIPNALMAEYYVQRASAGVIISEATTISEEANGWNESPGIYTDEMEGGWRQVVQAVHQAGGVIFLQLWHMGRASHSSFHQGRACVAPSAIRIDGVHNHTPAGAQPYEVPRALETSEIARVVEDYRCAAERAKSAGFDGVEIHAANGYLIDQFLQSKTNHRTDEYGGSVANRYRFLGEILASVSTVLPVGRIGVRLSPNGVFNDMGSADFREQFTYVAERLDEFGPAWMHVMDGLAFGFHDLGKPMTLSDFRAVYRGTLMGNCGYTQESAELAIAEGRADLIAFGRPYLSNPDLVERFRNGWELAPPAPMSDWYTPNGARGYVDFPAHA